MRPSRRDVAVTIAVGVLLAGCGSDSDDTASTVERSPSAVEVVATNYAFSGLAPTIAAGSTISLTTAKDSEPHEIIFMRIKDSETRSFDELDAADPGTIAFDPSFSLFIIAVPGETDTLVKTGDGTLEPGRYVYFCSINQGTTVEAVQAYASGAGVEPPLTGGSPHYELGMAGNLVVE